jgi:raffinose/stachyose/melibiose transport system permease protein
MKRNTLSYKVKQYLMFGGVGTLLFAAVVIVPFIYGIYLTFTSWDGVSPNKPFVGFANYAAAFADHDYWLAMGRTVIYSVFAVVLINILAFAMAYLVTSGVKGQNFFRAGFFVPNLIGGIVLGYVWKFVFNRAFVAIGTAITGHQVTSLLATPSGAMFCLIFASVWQYAGYIMLIYITGLNTIPGDVLEASAIDGANPLQTLFEIKIPMIAPTITICTFLTLTSAFKQFDVNLALTNGTGSVASFLGSYLTNGTEMLALNIYSTAVVNNEYAFGEAKAVLFFIILACVSILQVRISNKKEVEL